MRVARAWVAVALAMAVVLGAALVFDAAPSMAAAPSPSPSPEPIPPAKPFPSEVFKARRAKLLKALGGGIAVLHARGEEDADGFRQDADFYYLTGINEAGAVLVLTPGERTYKEWLFLAPRDPDEERWAGVRPNIGDSLRRATGIERIQRSSGLHSFLMRLAQGGGPLHMIGNPGRLDGPPAPEMELYGKLTARLPGLAIKDRTDLLPALRSVKEPRELERIEKAIEATVGAHRVAARAIRPGVEENWIAGLIDLEFKRGGAVRPAFPAIVGSGKNSTILHYPEHSETIAAGSLIVVDIGSDYGRYAADITRTYPADGTFTPEQRHVYEVVLRAQQACIDMIQPGVYFEDLQRKAEEIIRAAGYRDYFIHGLGHFLGLDVHDAGLYRKPLQAGMVLTIEPGVYIPEKALGVRIEDDVLVTPTGHRLLTAALPRDPDAIEAMMRGE
ncbi:MAG TPA: Xaa-Pro peptidase family protein [Candidatus Eisenbacteria bacterium]|nr:Xaa-Pro peptidase family protein [Candidatus Eisenbacteria bacterium]